MIAGKVTNGQQDCVLEMVWRTSNMFDRMKGLLGWPMLNQNQGMWIEPCSAVHTFFMKYDLDLVFLDTNGVVQKTLEQVGPWTMATCPGARTTLELSAGSLQLSGIQKGQTLRWKAE